MGQGASAAELQEPDDRGGPMRRALSEAIEQATISYGAALEEVDTKVEELEGVVLLRMAHDMTGPRILDWDAAAVSEFRDRYSDAWTLAGAGSLSEQRRRWDDAVMAAGAMVSEAMGCNSGPRRAGEAHNAELASRGMTWVECSAEPPGTEQCRSSAGSMRLQVTLCAHRSHSSIDGRVEVLSGSMRVNWDATVGWAEPALWNRDSADWVRDSGEALGVDVGALELEAELDTGVETPGL